MSTLRKSHSHVSLAFLLALLALLLVFGLAVAACGGNETASSTSPSAASPSPAVSYGGTTSSTSPPAAGTSMAVSYAQPPYSPTKAVAPPTVGWEFKPSVDIEVTALGCFDADQDGLARSHRVGIFDARTERLLAHVIVRPNSALDGAFRWESLGMPVVLRAGHSYLIGTEEHAPPPGADSQETLYEEGAEQWASEIAYRGLRTNLGAATGFTAPTNDKKLWAMIRMTYMSPNFKFMAVSASSPTP